MRVSDRRQIARTGLEVTAMGLGCAAFGGLYEPVDAGVAHEALRAAWSHGIRYFDVAPMYGLGRAEHILGDFLREDVPGEEAVVSTKVGRLMVSPRPGRAAEAAPKNPFDSGWLSGLGFTEVFDYSYDGLMRSFDDSQQRMGRTRLDLLFIHDIGEVTHGANQDRHWQALTAGGGFRALAELREAGIIRGFGLGVNECAVIEAAMEEADLDCCLLAGRYTLLDREGADLLDKAHARQVAIVAGGVFNSGILAGGFAKFDYVDAPAEIVARTDRLATVCARHGVPLGAAAIQFPLRHAGVSAVMVGARSPGDVNTNCEWFELEIPEALWAELDAIT